MMHRESAAIAPAVDPWAGISAPPCPPGDPSAPAAAAIRRSGPAPARWALALAATLAAACFVDSGSATDASGGATSTTATASTATATSTSTSTSTSTLTATATSEGTSTTDEATAGDPSGSATTGPSCAPLGASCGVGVVCCGECGACGDEGTCVATDALCGECMVCDAAACVLAPEGSACGDPLECATVVLGIKGGACLAAAGTAPGRCSSRGACTPPDPAECTQAGAAIVECPECLRKDYACQAGTPAASITVEGVCYTDGRVCDQECAGDEVVTYGCAGDGSCDKDTSENCDPYTCSGGACLSDCTSNADCATFYKCADGACV
jgi:hypothetical protein